MIMTAKRNNKTAVEGNSHNLIWYYPESLYKTTDSWLDFKEYQSNGYL